jgi:hypothetical protein
MTFLAVRGPHCHREQRVNRGKTARGTQCSLGQHALGATGSLQLASRHRGGVAAVKQSMIDRSRNARGVRDTARSRHLRPTPVLSARKQPEAGLEAVHPALLRPLPRRYTTASLACWSTALPLDGQCEREHLHF